MCLNFGIMTEHRKNEENEIKQNGSIYQEAEPLSWKFWRKKRYVVILMLLIGYLNSLTFRVSLSVGIVAMTQNRTVHYENGTIGYEQEFPWDSKDRGFILSSYFWGYMTTQILGGVLATKFGGCLVFGIGITATSIMTLLIPVAAKSGIYTLMAARAIAGIAEGVTFPAIYAILSRWAPPLERSRMGTIVIIGSNLGTVISMPISGILAEQYGWESIFYVFGAIGCSWYIFWVIIVREGPEKDKSISKDELQYIQNSLGTTENTSIKHPWKDMFTSKAVYAVVLAHCAENWGFYTMLTQLPSFLSDTMGFNLDDAGFLSAAPYLAMCSLMVPAGYIADKFQIKGYLTTTQVRRYFNCGGFLIQTLLLMGAAYIMTPFGTMACIIMAIGVESFAWCGFGVNALDIAPQHASAVMGISNTFSQIPGIISPMLTGFIVVHSTREEWQIIFMIAGGMYFIGCIFYWFWVSGEVQPWAEKSTAIQHKGPDDEHFDRTFVGYSNEGFEIPETVQSY